MVNLVCPIHRKHVPSKACTQRHTYVMRFYLDYEGQMLVNAHDLRRPQLRKKIIDSQNIALL